MIGDESTAVRLALLLRQWVFAACMGSAAAFATNTDLRDEDVDHAVEQRRATTAAVR
ncbi:hypothetical protein [Streptomyces atratus]|uniref:hypothetical protein n=1 Tax=Streptomyces atratus TaxID=1893 RepID=UPI00225AC9DF|nr:hypothetical protein [Streptomyces atratus]MCX5345225.1 hypothetical protein [Streptomyces atratus]